MNGIELLATTVVPATRPSGRDHDRPTAHLVASLREASVTIDALWRSCLQGGSPDMAVPLGEASHAVHRALIALHSARPD